MLIIIHKRYSSVSEIFKKPAIPAIPLAHMTTSKANKLLKLKQNMINS